MTEITADPKHPNTVYVGTDLAGVFKSTNGGKHFKPINRGLKNLAIQTIAIDPQHTAVVYIGTRAGGIYKSTDGGMHWKKKNNGLPASGAKLNFPVKALAIDPQNTQVLYAAYGEALGNNFVIHSEGYKKYSTGDIYKSTDGGRSWTIISTGAAHITSPAYVYELEVDPQTSSIIYATTDTGFYVSTDGGINWTARSTGLPYHDVRGLAVDPDHPNIVYVTVWSKKKNWQGGVYRSTDRGQHWTARSTGLHHSTDSNYPMVIVDPTTPTTIYTTDSAGNGRSGIFKSTDSGQHWDGLIEHATGKKAFVNLDIWKNDKTDGYGNASTNAIAISAKNNKKTVCNRFHDSLENSRWWCEVVCRTH
jgi:photosystem II stability/assembly factor-like uncharacterized protein